MASCIIIAEWITVCSNALLCATALHSAYHLFKDHRAPSVGMFLLGLSAGLSLLPASMIPYLSSVQSDMEWASERTSLAHSISASPLLSFGFLWLSEDRNTAHLLLIGSGLFLGLCDWLSSDALMLMTRCLAVSSVSCSLTVCLFAGNALGALGGVALSLPSLVAPRAGAKVLSGSLISLAATEGLLRGPLKGCMAVGCWASTQGLHKLLLEVTAEVTAWD